MKPESFITLNESEDTDEVKLKDLQRIVDKLMYIACRIRPDITFTVDCLSQNVSDLQLSHIKVVK